MPEDDERALGSTPTGDAERESDTDDLPLEPSKLELMMLDIHGGDQPLKWPGEWCILSALWRIRGAIGHKAFEHSINMLGHDVQNMIISSGNCRGSWLDVRSMIEAGGWNLRMVLMDEDTVFLGLEQVHIIKGSPTLMASGNWVTIMRQVPSALDLIRQRPMKLHPRIRQLRKPIYKPSQARIRWHGQMIDTHDPQSWAEVTSFGIALDPGFRRLQAQRKGAKAQDYLSVSRKILGMRVDKYENYGRHNTLPSTLSRSIVKYRIAEHHMRTMDAKRIAEGKGKLEGDGGSVATILDDCRGM